MGKMGDLFQVIFILYMGGVLDFPFGLARFCLLHLGRGYSLYQDHGNEGIYLRVFGPPERLSKTKLVM